MRPTRSDFSSNGSSYRAAYAREVAALGERIIRKQAAETSMRVGIWLNNTVGNTTPGKP
ncbi:MAG: hypothetical protein V1862_05165 [Methanobacteriota archaeon]